MDYKTTVPIQVGRSARPVLPVDVAVTSWRSPSPSWEAKQGCAPGSFGVATECRACKAAGWWMDHGTEKPGWNMGI